ncbi:hypothetical protein [Falsihalocynthiibacter arcticus]|uniref:Tetratricopeptide repeat-like domain-containing protein n=1 Tax=Falsihalocynthiibacter arcticus TaxID=1579316 RepID=A0A126V2E9_9RHOB|nr:hypothetical protein [Falsihalocynthiibacter arcticus]AML52317.1 hypothetical protein RC74_14470 [Falsihalocynthiibacter arcticus]
MSDTDSFIDEVSEEVRQDRLFGYMRKYGWVAGALVLLLVGGTAVNEARRASAQASAESFGDEVITAMLNNESAARVTELAVIQAPSPQANVILAFLQSGEETLGSEGSDAAIAALDVIKASPESAQVYRDLAGFKAALLLGAGVPAADRKAAFAALIVPGSAFRLLAEEQVALIEVEMDDKDAAIARLNSISQDAELTSSLRQRVEQWKLVLGVKTATG